MTLFGRSFVLFAIAVAVVVGVLNDAIKTPAFGQDAVADAVPTIVEDDAIPTIVDEAAEEEVIPYIAEDEEDEAPVEDGASTTIPSTTPVNTEGGLPKLLMDFLILNWHLVAGVLAALILLPILSRLIFRRKDPVAKYAAASMAKGSDVVPDMLPEARPADPLAIDNAKTYTHDGSVTPIELGQAQLVNDDLVTEYAGSSVAPGSPDYPAIPSAPVPEITVVEENLDETIPFDDDNGLEFVDDEPLVVLEEDAEGDKTERPAPDMDGTFEVAEQEVTVESQALADEVANNDDDIEEFEAANANDPFAVADQTESDDTVASDDVDLKMDETDKEASVLETANIDDLELAEENSEGIDEEELAAEVATEEFSDAGDDDATPMVDDSDIPAADTLANGVGFGAGIVGAAGVAAASQASPAAIQPASHSSASAQVIETRIAAIQEALAKEQRRTAELDEEQRQLKDLVAQLRIQLASSGSPSTTVVPELAANPSLHASDGDAIVRLQSENRELLLKLQEEQAQRQAGELQLRSLESSVRSLDARLNLVNSERDNLARMLYDAKQHAARQSG